MLRPSIVLTVALLLAYDIAAAQQLAFRRLSPRQVPPEVTFRGSLEAARQWRDRAGDNLLLLTRTEEMRSASSEGGDRVLSREIYAYHYVGEAGRYRLLWRTIDVERECQFDLSLEFGPGSLQITDVDADGLAETSFVYVHGCRGGVDPLGMKLILHEGATKYAIRGSTDLRELGAGYPGPVVRLEPGLTRVPALRGLAERQWNRFVRQHRWQEGPP